MLERLAIGAIARFPPELAEDLPALTVAAEQVTQGLLLSLRSYVWVERGQTEVVMYPASWWEAFKERWFPDWLRERFPVQYTRREIQTHVLHPDLARKIAVPEGQRVLWQCEWYAPPYGGKE